MNLKDIFPEIFRRPVPVVAEGTALLVAGTLLDTPRRDVLPIVRSSNKSIKYVRKNRKELMAFAGHAILSKLIETKPRYYHRFLFQPIEKIALSVSPIKAEQDITSLLQSFSQTKFGWSVVEDHGAYALATLSDLIQLYRRGVLNTSLGVKDVATKIFALPKDTKLGKALHEMMNHWVRRVFLSGTNRFVSDREILSYIFSPERLAVIKESPSKMLEAKLEDLESVEPIAVKNSTTLRDASELFKPLSGAWCLQCDEGIVTPWDLIMKPWKMESLTVNEAIERAPNQRMERN